MSIEEKFYELIMEIEKETGVRDGLTKVGFDRRVFDHIVYTLNAKGRMELNMQTIANGGAQLFGVPIVVREKESF